ncbi:MAG: TMEM165/GDT1 family protein [Candidatus Hydrothermarchaeales archaeon]
MATVILILLSEIADKTQLVILGIALRYKSPFKVSSGALLAHALMDGIAIIIGAYLGFSIPATPIKILVGIIFILLGLWSLTKIYLKREEREEKEITTIDPLMASFSLVLLSEFGDKTQITSGLLAAKYRVPTVVFIGTIIGLALAIGSNVFFGSKIAERLPRSTIKKLTAFLFILFGIFTLMF